MNFYKKVSETQINPANVVDSFSTGDDKITNAPSIRLVGDTFNANFAQEYNGDITYPKGSYCMHNKQLYKARVVTGDEDWNVSKWDATDVDTELKMINGTLTDIEARPYIVETGTSGVWKYKKWSDGRAELWGALPASVSSWVAWGNVFESTNSFYTTFPSWFSNDESFVAFISYATAAAGAMSIETVANAVANSTPLMHITRGASASGGYFSISMHARGRWQ